MGLFSKTEKTDGEKTFTVRGVNFPLVNNGYIPLSELTRLYLLFKAIDGDALARELLDAANAKIINAEGDIIYPLQ